MLEVTGLTVAYDDNVAVRALDLTAADGEVVAVIGPSGCGKSTLLRAIAGLEVPREGDIRIDGRSVLTLRPDQRDVGLMFQDHALFPHRTVADNVGFGPRMRGLPAGQVRERVRDALALVDLAGTEDRRVTELSGGEQQRVALARTIAPRPRLLMLDEPLGSLDRALSDRLMAELPGLFERLGTTVLYVTHDQSEALALADRVAVMREGVIEQDGTPDHLWRRPANEFVARFLGLDVIVDADVRDGVARTPLGTLPMDGARDGRIRAVVLPEAVRWLPKGDEPADREQAVTGRVTSRTFAGDHVVLHVEVESGVALRAPVWRGTGPPVGEQVALALDPTGLVPLASGTGPDGRGQASSTSASR